MATVEQVTSAIRDWQSAFGTSLETLYSLRQRYESIDFNSDTALEQVVAIDNEYKAFVAEANPRNQELQVLAIDLLNSLPSGPEKTDLGGQVTQIQQQFRNYANDVRSFRDGMRAKRTELETAAKEKVDKSTEKTPGGTGDNKSSDDAAGGTGTTAKSSVVASSSTPPMPVAIKRLYNPLRDFSSVTYKISLYAITPDALNAYYTTGVWKTKDLELIVQSGGVNKGLDSPRNKYFNYDFGIDDLEITTLTNAKETGTASNSIDFKFKIYEPYAMTFPTRLLAMQQDLQQRANIKTPLKEQTQALAIPLLLVIRFYGYDVNGELVSGAPTAGGSQTQTDEKAAFERAWPVQITKLNFKLDNKVTVYDLNAKTVNEQVAYGAKRGIVPAPITVTAATVESAIGGAQGTNGLLDQINNLLNQITNTDQDKKKQSVSDVYKVRFMDSSIQEALIVDKDFYVKSRAPMAKVNSPDQATVRTSVQATTVDKKNRVIEIASGTPILTAIDQIITQSTYLRDVMKVIDDEELEPTLENEQTYTKSEPKKLYWYCVVPETKIINSDEIRNDYAWEITYVIYKYAVPYVKSLINGPTPNYPGPNKRYDYWYTGKNTEVLSYEQQYNMLYYLGAALGSESGTPENSGDVTPNKAIPGQDANPMGVEAGKKELQNSLKTFLYSPGDQIKAQIKILGDPDYLMPALSGPTSDEYAINPTTTQIFIEIDFKQVEDYNTETTGIANDTVVDHGLLKPNSNIKFWDYPEDVKKQTEGRMVFMLTKVTSRFIKGTFTQDLKTILPNFPKTDPATTNAASTTPPVSDAGAGRSTSSFAATDPRRVDLSTAGAGRSSADFAAVDPRRIDTATNTQNTNDDSNPTPTTPNNDDSGREE